MTTRQRKQYLTAAHRRRQDPYEFELDGEVIRGVYDVDLAEIAPLIDELRRVMASVAATESITESAQVIHAGREIVGRFVNPEMIPAEEQTEAETLRSDVRPTWLARWEAHKHEVDAQTLLSIVFDLVEEYTGANPTSRSASSERSETPGSGSTDGAPPAVSTPSPYQSPELSTPG